MSDVSNVVTLAQPLDIIRIVNGEQVRETITQVTVKSDIRAKDLRCTDHHDGEIAKTIALIARLTGLRVAEVDELTLADLTVLGEKLGESVPAGLLTTKTA
jgi:hypothetical protein